MRLQAELDRNSVAFDEKLAASASSAAADREALRSDVRTLTASIQDKVRFHVFRRVLQI